jgi:hypothetical protein
MPSYLNVVPPSSLSPGDVGFSFNNETFPGSAQAGSQFALRATVASPILEPRFAGRQFLGRRRQP